MNSNQRNRPVAYLAALIAFAGLAALCTRPLIAGPAPSNPETAVGLVAKDQTIITDPATPVYDFGQRAASDETPVTHVFILQNKTDHPVTIDMLRPSCDCISAKLYLDTSPQLPYLLKPNASVPVQVMFLPEYSSSGPIEKHVYVFLHGQTPPATLLRFKGAILAPAHPS